MASIRKRTWSSPTGTKEAFCVDWKDASGRRHRKQFEKKGEATIFKLQIELQLKTGTFRAEAHRLTVDQLGHRYIENCSARRRRGERMTRGSFDVIEGHIRNYVCAGSPGRVQGKNLCITPFQAGVGGLKLASLTNEDVCDFRDRLRDAGLSVPQTRKVLKTFSTMLEFGRSKSLIGTNPAKGVVVIGKRNEGSKKVYPPSEFELQTIIDYAPARLRFSLIFSAATGIRAGEMHALRYQHIDWAKREMTIETRVDRYGEEDDQGEKSLAGNRTLLLGPALFDELVLWRERSKFALDSDLIFPNTLGKYWQHDTMRQKVFYPIFARIEKLREAGSPIPPVKRFTWHGLRHYAISKWISKGCDIKTVQTWAGHSSAQITLDRYGHLFLCPEHAKVVAEVALELLKPRGLMEGK